MSDSKLSSGVAFLTMLKFAYFWLLGVHLGSQRGHLRDSTLQNMMFGMSFDSLMTIARKRNGSKKSQSLGSDIKRHITLRSKEALQELQDPNCFHSSVSISKEGGNFDFVPFQFFKLEYQFCSSNNGQAGYNSEFILMRVYYTLISSYLLTLGFNFII